MHRPGKVAHSPFIEGSHKTKNMASGNVAKCDQTLDNVGCEFGHTHSCSEMLGFDPQTVVGLFNI